MVTFNVDSLDFVDDEEARFGADADFATRFDSANSRLELEDLTNATVGFVPQNVGTDLVGGKFAETVSEGKALADDGNVYDTIQRAVNNASSWVKVGPGTFNEQVLIDFSNFTLAGSGQRTVIVNSSDANFGNAIQANGTENVTLRDFTVINNSQNTNGDGINISSNESTISNIRIKELGPDHKAIDFSGNDGLITNCTIEDGDLDGIRLRGVRCNVINNNISGISGIAIRIRDQGDDNIIASNVIKNIDDSGIYITNDNDNIVYANRIDNTSGIGIREDGVDNIIVNNRISNASTAVSALGTGGVVQDNLTT